MIKKMLVVIFVLNRWKEIKMKWLKKLIGSKMKWFIPQNEDRLITIKTKLTFESLSSENVSTMIPKMMLRLMVVMTMKKMVSKAATPSVYR